MSYSDELRALIDAFFETVFNSGLSDFVYLAEGKWVSTVVGSTLVTMCKREEQPQLCIQFSSADDPRGHYWRILGMINEDGPASFHEGGCYTPMDKPPKWLRDVIDNWPEHPQEASAFQEVK